MERDQFQAEAKSVPAYQKSLGLSFHSVLSCFSLLFLSATKFSTPGKWLVLNQMLRCIRHSQMSLVTVLHLRLVPPHALYVSHSCSVVWLYTYVKGIISRAQYQAYCYGIALQQTILPPCGNAFSDPILCDIGSISLYGKCELRCEMGQDVGDKLAINHPRSCLENSDNWIGHRNCPLSV